MATGTLSSPEVNTTGQEIEFTVTGGTWASDITVDPDKCTISLTSESYTGTTLGTTTRDTTIIAATYSGGILTAELVEPIHDDDTLITVVCDAGLFDDGTDTSAALSSTSVSNGSALDYAVPFCVTASKVYEKVTSTYNARAIAAAGAYSGHVENYGIAAVEFNLLEPIEATSVGTFTDGETITGGTSGATAELIEQVSNTLFIRSLDGTWSASETITGDTSGATCTYSSGGRKATRTTTSLDDLPRLGTNGWQSTYQAFEVDFDITTDFSGGAADRVWLTLDVKAYPTIGDAGAIRTDSERYVFSNTGTAYDALERWVDPTGDFTLSANTDDTLTEGERIVGDTSGAEAIVNQDYATNQSSISVSYVRGSWSGTEVFTADGGATGTISSIAWNGDNSNAGTSGAPMQTLQKAVKDCEDTSTDGTASWSTIYLKAGKNMLGPYSFSLWPDTTDGPVTITRDTGVGITDAVISGSCDATDTNANDGLRTNLIRLYDLKVDFKWFGAGNSNIGFGMLSTGSTPGGGIMGGKSGLILDTVEMEGFGKSDQKGMGNLWHDSAFDGGVYVYNSEFHDLAQAQGGGTQIDCDVYLVGSDWHRAGSNNVCVNCKISMNATGSPIHADIWQFEGTGIRHYENTGMYQVLAYDLERTQIGPFFNGENSSSDDTRSRIISGFMALCIQEPDDTVNIAQIDDCFLKGWYCYNNSFGDTIYYRNNAKQENSWWRRNYWRALNTSGAVFQKTGSLDNHDAGGSHTISYQLTEGGNNGSQFEDFDTTYLPSSSGDLRSRGYTDVIMPKDVNGTAWLTDGTDAIGAVSVSGEPVSISSSFVPYKKPLSLLF